jgi:DNA-binding response OmpR family regulator
MRQAIDLALKLLRNIDQVDMSVGEDLEILLQPVSDRKETKELPTSTSTTPNASAPSAQNDAGVVIDPTSGVVAVDGQPAPSLTRLEFELLLFLYRRADSIVGRQEISRALWPDEPEENRDAALEKLVSRVRLKVESKPEQPTYLLTVRGRGYRLVTKFGMK